jgi:hypothetical protein
VLAKAVNVSITSSLKFDLNSICSVSRVIDCDYNYQVIKI